MNSRAVVCSVIAACIGIAVLAPPQGSSAEPILKPRKYHGPIPKRYFTLGIGLVGGAENQEMWNTLENQIISALGTRIETKDFGASLSLDGSYTVKLHPQFAFRSRAGLAVLLSESTGEWKPAEAEHNLAFERDFDIWLFSLDATGIFYFQDASVKTFQTYTGAGLGFYFPYAAFTEDLRDAVTRERYPSKETTEWDIQPGAHAILGFLYHINTTTALGMEGRVQIAMSKFRLTYLNTVNQEQTVNFDVDYTGFILGVTVSKFF